jgi:hypothetical protein
MTFRDDELDEFLVKKLKLIEATPPRDPKVAKNRRDEFIKNTSYMKYRKPMFSIAQLLNRKPKLKLFSQHPTLVPVASAILLIFGLVFGSWGTVYAAQDSKPNELLYFIKLSEENFRLALTFDPEARITLLTSYIDHRIEEATTLALQGESIPETLADRTDKYFDQLFALMDSLDEASEQEALKGLQIHLRDRDQDMTNAMNGLPDKIDPLLVQLREMVQAHQQVAQMGLDKPNSLQFQQRHKHRQDQPTTPITDTITTTVTITPSIYMTPEITITRTITSGQYGPGGPCDQETEECAPFGYMTPFEGTHPESEDHRGYGPGPIDGEDPKQPAETPKPEDVEQPKEPTQKSEEMDPPKGTPEPEDDGNSSKGKGDSGTKKGKP